MALNMSESKRFCVVYNIHKCATKYQVTMTSIWTGTRGVGPSQQPAVPKSRTWNPPTPSPPNPFPSTWAGGTLTQVGLRTLMTRQCQLWPRPPFRGDEIRLLWSSTLPIARSQLQPIYPMGSDIPWQPKGDTPPDSVIIFETHLPFPSPITISLLPGFKLHSWEWDRNWHFNLNQPKRVFFFPCGCCGLRFFYEQRKLL